MKFEMTIKVDGNLLYTAGGILDETLGKTLHFYVTDYMKNYYDKDISTKNLGELNK